MVPQARQNEMEVRLAVRTAEERVSSIAGRADSLARQATAERAGPGTRRGPPGRARPGRGHRPCGRRRRPRALQRSPRRSPRPRSTATSWPAHAPPGRRSYRRYAAAAKRLGAELERLTNEVHRDEVARAEQRLRIEQLEAKAAEDFAPRRGDADRRVRPRPAGAAHAGRRGAGRRDGLPVPEPVRYERPVQEKRAAKAERDLALLGKVNPLALEEFAALEERFKFLSEQLEDLKATRKDLLTVVKDVDDRILEVFASAFDDTAREFEQVFTVLFPGGEGRLILTDPEDLLTTGVEVEARPPGKKIKRLSLLSGGERSLTAVAMLVAIFRARPSPFYIMDEVEAALDDVNLGRLITLLAQLREKSQLIVITHQKRTMEIADALYGVTMRSGVTQVISQRLNRADEDD